MCHRVNFLRHVPFPQARNHGRRAAAGLIVVGALSALASCAQPPEPGPPAPFGTVLRVIDGDTVVVRVGTAEESVRLLGIDTPEVAHHGQANECFGPEAAERTEALLPPGTTVQVLRDAEARDVYGRLLGYLVLDDRLINDILLAEGYATTLSIAPNTSMSDHFSASERNARREQRGLWAAC